MDNVLNTVGKQGFNCAEFAVRAELPSGAAGGLDDPKVARVSVSADGAAEDGIVALSSNGRVGLSVEDATIDVMPGGIVVDAGDTGNIGLRAGTAPCQQSIDVQGNTGSIVLQNGQLPMTPKIEIGKDSIELSVGLNKITIGPTGIEISGATVDIEGTLDVSMKGLNVGIEANVAASVKGTATAELSASGPTTVKGAMVMIN